MFRTDVKYIPSLWLVESMNVETLNTGGSIVCKHRITNIETKISVFEEMVNGPRRANPEGYLPKAGASDSGENAGRELSGNTLLSVCLAVLKAASTQPR